MIELTRLNGNPLFVNCDLIKWAEASPDTMLTLVNGEKVLVHESCAQVVERMTLQRAKLLAEVVKLVPDGRTLLHLATFATTLPSPRQLGQKPIRNTQRLSLMRTSPARKAFKHLCIQCHMRRPSRR
ncbi:hypothetical protein ACPOL_5585 [Acidisarcina polymorpha]|uniref:Flagellar protein FlbD n=1 Tax=Acidisarcina polymorpha TaxID=2211140 RepID=A0A2Z5G6E6_9BACT|nr:flagellar FlbD family protein [Acidisarcina polymorpha]AXC14833.1 hypothetical protein ACPOL_5585 [Acidisarcina polymorpha]